MKSALRSGVRRETPLTCWAPKATAAAVLAIVGCLAIARPAFSQVADHRWAGMIHDSFTIDGEEAWTVEDGGRIRHRSAAGVWSYQTTPAGVESQLRRVFFLPDGLTGWAVGENGWVINTTDGGANWNVLWQAPSVLVPGEFEPLWDVHFLDANNGWVVGGHAIWHHTAAAGWYQVNLVEPVPGGGYTPIDQAQIELYSVDVVGSAGAILGLACGEPGLILKSTSDGDLWVAVLDMRQLCGLSVLPDCVENNFCQGGDPIEPWDIEISRNPTSSLALCVGGNGSGCGYALASTDNGDTWAFEPHECQCQNSGCTTCNGDPDYRNDGGTNETWRLKPFNELYGVAIFRDTNEAVASGYGGQIVLRDPNPGGPTAVWRDRSTYSDKQFTAPSSVTQPGFGASTANLSDVGNTKAFWTGSGGYVRHSTDGGNIWTGFNTNGQPMGDPSEQPFGPWRIRDVYFTSPTTGFMVSQFSRIARTANAGLTWEAENQSLTPNTPFLQAITADASGTIGVAVGDTPMGHNNPNILVNDDLSNTSTKMWPVPTNIVYVPGYDPSAISVSMREVTWAGGNEFWAVGTTGLIYHSDPVQGPAAMWHQFVPPGEVLDDFQQFSMEGVSFSGTSDGVFVGKRTIGTQVLGKAYHYHDSGTNITWTEIDISNEPNLASLNDVAFAGTMIYAVGSRVTGALEEGVVLSAKLTGSTFDQLVARQAFADCTIGDALGGVPVLSEVEVDPGGAIWLGGKCGRLWRSPDGQTWSPIRSLTDAHVWGMSFPAADTGFVAGHRSSRTNNCIVRVTP